MLQPARLVSIREAMLLLVVLASESWKPPLPQPHGMGFGFGSGSGSPEVVAAWSLVLLLLY